MRVCDCCYDLVSSNKLSPNAHSWSATWIYCLAYNNVLKYYSNICHVSLYHSQRSSSVICIFHMVTNTFLYSLLMSSWCTHMTDHADSDLNIWSIRWVVLPSSYASHQVHEKWVLFTTHIVLMSIWIFCMCKAKFRWKHVDTPCRNAKTQKWKSSNTGINSWLLASTNFVDVTTIL